MQCDSVKSSNVVAIRPLGAPRLIVEHNTFDNIGGYLMRYVNGPDIAVRYNHFEIIATGIKIWGASVDRPIIEHNTFRCDGNGRNPETSSGCIPQYGVSFSNDVHNGLIRNNTFDDCPVAVSFSTSETYGSRPNVGTVVDSNTALQSVAICNPWESSFRIDDCTGASSNTGAPLYVADITFRNNVLRHQTGGVGAAVFLQSGHDTAFSNDLVLENNTIAGYRIGVRIDQCQGYAHHLNGVELRNNLMDDIERSYYSLTLSGGQGTFPSRIVSDNNVMVGSKEIRWPTALSLAEWQSQFAQDRSTSTCSPLYQSGSEWRLSASDTCARDQGVDRPELGFDIDGDPRPRGALDIGADEVCVKGPCSCLFCDGFENGLAGW